MANQKKEFLELIHDATPEQLEDLHTILQEMDHYPEIRAKAIAAVQDGTITRDSLAAFAGEIRESKTAPHDRMR